VQAQFYAVLTDLLGEPNWEDPSVRGFKVLTGKDVGLAEIICEVLQQDGKKQRKRQIRGLGIWPPDLGEFVLLNGFEKSGKSPIPPNAFSEAHRLRRQYGQGRGTVNEFF
jgi:hypothetical protein